LNSGSDIATNIIALKQLIGTKTEQGDPILIAKPTLRSPHPGGKIFDSSSTHVTALQSFLDTPPSDEDIQCARKIGVQSADQDPILKDRDLLPSRLLRRASLALRGRLPNLSEYAQIKASPDRYASMVDSYMREGNQSGVLHDRVHVHVMRRFLSGLVSDPVTLGSNMLGLGIEARNKIRSGVKEGYSPNPNISRIWNRIPGNQNKALEPSTGCRKLVQANLESNYHEYWSTFHAPLAQDLSDCVYESPIKTAVVNFRRYFNPGFSRGHLINTAS